MEYTLRKLGSFSEMKYGKMPNKKMLSNDGKYPVFSGYRVVGYCDECNINEQQLVVVARGVGGTGDVKLSPGACYLTNLSIAVLVDERVALKKYLYYYFLKNNLRYLDSGSAQSQITIGDLKNVEVPLPALETQEKIVSILNAIEKKIDSNVTINDNLYAQARAIKRQWVAKNKDRYELLPLIEVAAINPDTYSPKEAWEYVNYLDTSSITNGFIADIQHIVPSSEKLPSRARRKVAAGDVLFSTVRPNQNHFGIISDPLPNMLASTGFAAIRSKNPLVCNELIYLCLTELDFIEKMQQLAEQSTSTFPSIKPSDLGTCQIPCPKDESSDAFTDTLKSLFALIAANFRENSSLATMREALLPKLMSGEIDVSAVQL